MIAKKWIIPVVLAITALVAGACLPSFGVTQINDVDQLNTAVAQTVAAELTRSVMETALAKATQLPSQQVITATSQPSTTDLPTATSQPPATSTPYPTATAVPCHRIQFMLDVTVPDGTVFAPGTNFVKTWRLRNAGSCTWTPDYSLVFRAGNAMGVSGVVSLNQTVYPGQSVDVSVTLTAPAAEGDYEGFWSLRSSDGILFGLGDNADVSFWVKIRSISQQSTWPPELPLDFAANFCSARWTNASGIISCPSAHDDFSNGSVNRTFDPKIEDDYQDDEITLVVIPSSGANGIISGRYPAVIVHSGDRFQALVGCMTDMDDCDVTFKLKYAASNGTIYSLGSWHEVYEGMHTRIDVDLSGLDGQQVEFILEVDNNGSSHEDKVFWMTPHIQR
ncbi:MAG: hypothetical protein K8R77_13200 [Anaerolineaceae bacterium]|nr:hypothetical protein [Anaerolineaceae bacterium]